MLLKSPCQRASVKARHHPQKGVWRDDVGDVHAAYGKRQSYRNTLSRLARGNKPCEASWQCGTIPYQRGRSHREKKAAKCNNWQQAVPAWYGAPSEAAELPNYAGTHHRATEGAEYHKAATKRGIPAGDAPTKRSMSAGTGTNGITYAPVTPKYR